MPYAKDDLISEKPIVDGIEIGADEYKNALKAKIKGQETATKDGKLVIYSIQNRTVYNQETGEKMHIPIDKDMPEGFGEDMPELPEPEYEPSELEVLKEALKQKGVLTDSELQEAKKLTKTKAVK